MRNIILKEVCKAIPEAEYEPTVTENILFESILIQEESDILGPGGSLPLHHHFPSISIEPVDPLQQSQRITCKE